MSLVGTCCLGFDALYAGRVLSVLAVMLISWTIALCIRRFEACWSAAVLGGLLFLGLMVRYADWYVAMNDPNLLALTIMMCGLVWLLRRDPKQGAEGPFLVLVLGGSSNTHCSRSPRPHWSYWLRAIAGWRFARRWCRGARRRPGLRC